MFCVFRRVTLRLGLLKNKPLGGSGIGSNPNWVGVSGNSGSPSCGVSNIAPAVFIALSESEGRCGAFACSSCSNCSVAFSCSRSSTSSGLSKEDAGMTVSAPISTSTDFVGDKGRPGVCDLLRRAAENLLPFLP